MLNFLFKNNPKNNNYPFLNPIIDPNIKKESKKLNEKFKTHVAEGLIVNLTSKVNRAETNSYSLYAKNLINEDVNLFFLDPNKYIPPNTHDEISIYNQNSVLLKIIKE